MHFEQARQPEAQDAVLGNRLDGLATIDLRSNISDPNVADFVALCVQPKQPDHRPARRVQRHMRALNQLLKRPLGMLSNDLLGGVRGACSLLTPTQSIDNGRDQTALAMLLDNIKIT